MPHSSCCPRGPFACRHAPEGRKAEHSSGTGTTPSAMAAATCGWGSIHQRRGQFTSGGGQVNSPAEGVQGLGFMGLGLGYGSQGLESGLGVRRGYATNRGPAPTNRPWARALSQRVRIRRERTVTKGAYERVG
eukprot:1195380-Prorocentrum_minimum.AAC.9